MFDRWKKTHKAVYEVESENLAVPGGAYQGG